MIRTIRFLTLSFITFPANFVVTSQINNRSLPICLLVASLLSIAFASAFVLAGVKSSRLIRFILGTVISMTSSFVCVSNFNNYSLFYCISGTIFISCLFGWMFATPQKATAVEIPTSVG